MATKRKQMGFYLTLALIAVTAKPIHVELNAPLFEIEGDVISNEGQMESRSQYHGETDSGTSRAGDMNSPDQGPEQASGTGDALATPDTRPDSSNGHPRPPIRLKPEPVR